MTSKELKRLGRRDLLEMLIELTKENEQLRQKIQDLELQLEDKAIVISETGSLAEAVLRLNNVFQAAQAACDQYIYNIQLRCQLEEEARHPEVYDNNTTPDTSETV